MYCAKEGIYPPPGLALKIHSRGMQDQYGCIHTWALSLLRLTGAYEGLYSRRYPAELIREKERGLLRALASRAKYLSQEILSIHHVTNNAHIIYVHILSPSIRSPSHSIPSLPIFNNTPNLFSTIEDLLSLI